MSENEKKNSGKGKFFLGAAFGAVVGAIASKFISVKVDETNELDEPDEDDDELVDDESEECKECKECKCKKCN